MIGGGPSLCSSTMVNSNIYLLILIPPFQCLAWLGGYSFHYRTNGEPFRSYTIAWVPMRLPPSVRGTHAFSIGNSASYRNGRRLKNKKKDLPTNKHRRSNRCYLAVIVVDRPKFKLWDG